MGVRGDVRGLALVPAMRPEWEYLQGEQRRGMRRLRWAAVIVLVIFIALLLLLR